MTFLWLVASVGCAFGAPRDSGEATNVDRRGFALRGHDAVAYWALDADEDAVRGLDRYSYRWRGATWLFGSAGNRDQFAADPERYAPSYGGYCAMAMSQDALAAADPDAWTIRDGRLYVFARMRGRSEWLENPPEYIALADGYWPGRRAALLAAR